MTINHPNPFATANPFDAGAFELDANNPFAAGAARREPTPVPDDAPPGTYTYSLVQSGPPVAEEDVEQTGVEAVEITTLWGDGVLHVAHLSPPKSFYVGEEQKKHLACDLFIPAERLGTTRMPVVLADRSGTRLVIPPGASGHVELPGRGRMTLDEAREMSQPSVEVSGGHELELPHGARARIELDGFTFQVGAVTAGKPAKRGVAAVQDWALASSFGLSLLGAAAMVAAMAFFVPPLGLTEDDGADATRFITIQQYLKSSAEREQEQKDEKTADADSKNHEGGTGTQAKGSEGKMGNPLKANANKRWSVKGPADNPDPHLSHQEALREAQSIGMIGLLNTMNGSVNTPTAPWGRDTALGVDDANHQGNMWGEQIGDSGGTGGLGLSGIGEGGGGFGEGLGLGAIGTMGHGNGLGPGQGFGNGAGHLGGTHHPKSPPRMRVGATTVSGHLPPEAIQRVVRQNYGRFRMCFEQGLARNPNLQGRVTARFVIGRDGAVSNVSNGGSDLPDSGVVSCVVSTYYGLSFPSTDDGIVTVVYPIMFSPG
jgi:hypothetical protein